MKHNFTIQAVLAKIKNNQNTFLILKYQTSNMILKYILIAATSISTLLNPHVFIKKFKTKYRKLNYPL